MWEHAASFCAVLSLLYKHTTGNYFMLADTSGSVQSFFPPRTRYGENRSYAITRLSSVLLSVSSLFLHPPSRRSNSCALFCDFYKYECWKSARAQHPRGYFHSIKVSRRHDFASTIALFVLPLGLYGPELHWVSELLINRKYKLHAGYTETYQTSYL